MELGHAVQIAFGEIDSLSQRVLIIPGDTPLLCAKTLNEEFYKQAAL